MKTIRDFGMLQKEIKEYVDSNKKRGYTGMWEDFKKIGGNTELEDAKVVFIGENHKNPVHLEKSAKLIEALAKDGNVIVMLEEHESETEIAVEETYRFASRLSHDARKTIRVIGWDNLHLQDQSDLLARRLERLKKNRNENEDLTGNKEEEIKNLEEKLQDVAIIKRNKHLVKTLDKRIREYSSGSPNFNKYVREEEMIAVLPNDNVLLSKKSNDEFNATFVVIAGKGHFTRDKSLKESLGKYKYVILQLTHKYAYEEEKEKEGLKVDNEQKAVESKNYKKKYGHEWGV
jgi:hypothetical protein